jgi:hypothetical protein
MRSQGGRTVKMNTVEDAAREVAERGPANGGRVEALFDQNLFRMHMARERSSSFWFAASIFGISGLVIGACLGAYMMYVSSVATLPVAVDAVARGMAVERIQTDRDVNGPAIDMTGQRQPQQ